MHILITGKSGQLGKKLIEKLKKAHFITALGREDADLSIISSLKSILDKINSVDLIIHTAAYTDVDKAEHEISLAELVNIEATRCLATKAFQLDIPIIFISTDYVFDGLKEGPYLEEDIVNPLSVYGKTKWLAEETVREITKKHFILRASWIFSETKNNFLNNIIDLALRKENLTVIHDRIGAPTSASLIAEVIFQIIIATEKSKKDTFGTYHVSALGEVSWFNYAYMIVNEMHIQNVKPKLNLINLVPMKSEINMALANRPFHSRLNCNKVEKVFKVALPFWRRDVEKILNEILISKFFL